MESIDTIRDNIIDRVNSITDIDYLTAIQSLLNRNDDEIENLSDEQILMLKMSDKDIESGNLFSQEELDKTDLEWLKGQ